MTLITPVTPYLELEPNTTSKEEGAFITLTDYMLVNKKKEKKVYYLLNYKSCIF